ncbi:MAG: tRNA 2-selenouridine(34) synthase MnmH [Deltaproteobacteria bacterium]|nr:tRNA 2-selenouridine(34) synthase MnmH [Deltaproteobacteria bacterium]
MPDHILTPAELFQQRGQPPRLLDVRSEIEFMKGRLPCSVNLPILTTAERALVGTAYVHQGRDAATSIGHDLVSGSRKQGLIAAWTVYVSNEKAQALFCWRGGLRSKISQEWLKGEGIHLPRIAGGYKAARRYLREESARALAHLPLVVIGGRTGSGKTHFLLRPDIQSWSLDLEGSANHRGSSFGGILGDQPSQASFENAVAFDVLRERPSPGLIVEAESRRIGRLNIPDEIFARMQSAPIVILERPQSERVQLIFRDYVADPLARFEAADPGRGAKHLRAFLLSSIHKIEQHLGGELSTRLSRLLLDALPDGDGVTHADRHHSWIETLLREYYDPLYDRHEARYEHRVLARGSADEIASAARDALHSTQ